LCLRDTKGKVWGHPARGTESKYLLVGLARCGVCGSGLSVRTRGSKPRYYYYVCTAYHMRGRHVCSNRYELPMEDTDAAVLTAFGEQVLSPEMLEAAIDRAARAEPRQRRANGVLPARGRAQDRVAHRERVTRGAGAARRARVWLTTGAVMNIAGVVGACPSGRTSSAPHAVDQNQRQQYKKENQQEQLPLCRG
jgi:hypothetical protein